MGDQDALNPYDLKAPDKILYPAYTPIRDGTLSGPGDPYRIQGGPVPDGYVRVALGNDYYLGPYCEDYRPGNYARLVADIPLAQYERWRETVAAYWDMQDEIEAVIGQLHRRGT